MDTGIISIVIGVLGIVVGWWLGYWYYKRSSRDLAKEAAELKNLNILILRALENAGIAELTKDENGKPIGLTLKINVHS